MSQSRLKSLKTLRKLRVTESDQAKEDLAKAIMFEQDIETVLDKIRNDIAQNEATLRLCSSGKNDQIIMEMSYYNWRAAAQDLIEQKSFELTEAQHCTWQARQKMIEANTALEATDKLMAQIKKDITYQEERKIQSEIDDVARTGFIRRNRTTL